MVPLYVPILKGKEGEFAALETLRPLVKNQICPLIEVPAIPFDYSKGQSAKTLDDHIRTLPERLRKSLGTRPFYLEMPYFEAEDQLEDDSCVMAAVLARCSELLINPIPVVSPRSTSSCLRSVADASGAAAGGLCVRLSVKDFAEEIEIDDEVSTLLAACNRESATGVDLIVDFGELTSEPSVSIMVARSVLSVVPRRNEWRSIIIAASSFPEDLSGVSSATTAILPRREWDLWHSLQRKASALPRPNVIFADYAIAHPRIKDLDPRLMTMSASIRYTTTEGWLIVKGRNVRKFGFDQYFELCRTLVEHPLYLGSRFSWGDKYINDCALAETGPGNATTWRKVGVNHHITFVIGQISSLLAL